MRLRPLLLILAIALCGCLTEPVPTQNNPSCSWTTAPPANPNALCDRVFPVLRDVTRAIWRGDDATIRRYAAPPVASRIIAYGRRLRPLGITDLHVVPSYTMSVQSRGEFGAGFYVLGQTHHGPIKDQESVYLRVTRSSVRIMHDQPQQNW
jgi:hypothetical protein